MKRASYFCLLFVVLLLPSCGKVAGPDARERELSYLWCVMPESLLEFAHVEVPAIENIAISYGPDQSQKRGPLFIEPGRWHSLAVEIHWSQNADGRAVLFLDDLTITTQTAR